MPSTWTQQVPVNGAVDRDVAGEQVEIAFHVLAGRHDQRAVGAQLAAEQVLAECHPCCRRQQHEKQHRGRAESNPA
ncbi:MAG: hypothetical protein E6J47_03930 [Chloroflexi bacterium]|nr:MAG: hypothetical protein E6J47_03930 [Chloroflexota bacterium]